MESPMLPEELSYKILALDAANHSLLLINGPTGEILKELPYPAKFTPLDLSITPDFSKAFLPMSGGNNTGALFIANLTSLSLYGLPFDIPHPSQFAFAPSTNSVYIVDPTGMLYAIDTVTMAVTPWGKPESEKTACAGLAADGSAIYSVWEHNDTGTLAVFSPKGELTYEYQLPGIPTNIILSHHDHIIVPFTTTNFTNEGVAIFDKKQDGVSAAITLKSCIYTNTLSPYTTYPSHVATNPDEHIAYIVNEESASITVIDLETTSINRHIPLGRSISCLHILPGGQFAIASSHMFADLSLIDLVNGRLLSVTDSPREILGFIAVMPD